MKSIAAGPLSFHAQYDWTTGVPDNGMEEVPHRTSLATLASPRLVLCFFLTRVETEGLLDRLPGEGRDHHVGWNLCLVILGVEYFGTLRLKARSCSQNPGPVGQVSASLRIN